MIDDTIAQIEARLTNAGGMTDEQRAEMRTLLANLKTELTTLRRTDSARARSVVGSIDSTTAALARKGDVRGTLDELSNSIAGLEVQHPKLTELVNAFSVALSNAGI